VGVALILLGCGVDLVVGLSGGWVFCLCVGAGGVVLVVLGTV